VVRHCVIMRHRETVFSTNCWNRKVTTEFLCLGVMEAEHECPECTIAADIGTSAILRE
jgi:hypothetical protein